VQKIFRCENCQRGMHVVGSTGLGKEVERVVRCPYCKTKEQSDVAEGRQVQRAAHRHALGAFPLFASSTRSLRSVCTS